MDYSPVIAFCESRIGTLRGQLDAGLPSPAALIARIDELTMIVTLCKGLQSQEDMLRKQLGLVETI
jgi:hypothetical protein